MTEHAPALEKFKKNFMLFSIGALGYGLLEIAFRGFTHWTMLITGGIVFTTLYYYNSKNENTPLLRKCLTGALIITIIEFAAGCIVNLWLGWNVWDYSGFAFNVLGQICLAFTALWFFLCIPLAYFTRLLHLHRLRIRSH